MFRANKLENKHYCIRYMYNIITMIQLAVVPLTKNAENYAYEVIEHINKTVKADIQIDVRYATNTNERIEKYKRDNIDVIVVEVNDINKNTITVFYTDSVKPKKHKLGGFLVYLKGYEDAIQSDDDEEEKEGGSVGESNCVIF